MNIMDDVIVYVIYGNNLLSLQLYMQYMVIYGNVW